MVFLRLSPTLHHIKFANDTTVVGLILNSDEAPYRKEVQTLEAWCSNNQYNINTRNTINGEEVERDWTSWRTWAEL